MEGSGLQGYGGLGSRLEMISRRMEEVVSNDLSRWKQLDSDGALGSSSTAPLPTTIPSHSEKKISEIINFTSS